MRSNWKKNTAGRCHRPWGGHVATDRVLCVEVWLSSGPPVYIHIYLTTRLGLLNSELG